MEFLLNLSGLDWIAMLTLCAGYILIKKRKEYAFIVLILSMFLWMLVGWQMHSYALIIGSPVFMVILGYQIGFWFSKNEKNFEVVDQEQ